MCPDIYIIHCTVVLETKPSFPEFYMKQLNRMVQNTFIWCINNIFLVWNSHLCNIPLPRNSTQITQTITKLFRVDCNENRIFQNYEHVRYDGLILTGDKPLAKPMLTEIIVAQPCHHRTTKTISHNWFLFINKIISSLAPLSVWVKEFPK